MSVNANGRKGNGVRITEMMDGDGVEHVKVANWQSKKGILAIFGTEEKITVKRHQFSKNVTKVCGKKPSSILISKPLWGV